jgi:hypothetical protein
LEYRKKKTIWKVLTVKEWDIIRLYNRIFKNSKNWISDFHDWIFGLYEEEILYKDLEKMFTADFSVPI